MAKVPIEAAQAGMKLSKEVSDGSGQVLARSGIEISEKHLRVFRSWGVTHIEIDGDDSASPEDKWLSEVDPAIKSQADEFTKARFILTNLEHPPMQRLFSIASLRKLKELVGRKV